MKSLFVLGKIFIVVIDFIEISFFLRLSLTPAVPLVPPPPCRRRGVAARSGAALVPLGPGPKAPQPVRHHPPQRYEPGNPRRSAAKTQNPTKEGKRLNEWRITKRHLVEERVQQMSLDAVCSRTAWAEKPEPGHFGALIWYLTQRDERRG